MCMCVHRGGNGEGGIFKTFLYQQRVIVRFSCLRLLLLVPVKQKVMFTLQLMLKGQGALVGATYGLLVWAETGSQDENKRQSLERL